MSSYTRKTRKIHNNYLLYDFRYNKGVLLPRSPEDQTQVEIDKHTTTDKQTTLIQDVEESFMSEHSTTTITSNTYREMKFILLINLKIWLGKNRKKKEENGRLLKSLDSSFAEKMSTIN